MLVSTKREGGPFGTAFVQVDFVSESASRAT